MDCDTTRGGTPVAIDELRDRTSAAILHVCLADMYLPTSSATVTAFHALLRLLEVSHQYRA